MMMVQRSMAKKPASSDVELRTRTVCGVHVVHTKHTNAHKHVCAQIDVHRARNLHT